MIQYLDAEDIREGIKDIIFKLELDHVNLDRVACIRSKGTSSRGIIARCHALSKIMQQCLGCKAFYIIEVISERYDKMSEEDKTKVLIHELLHIPRTFGGGFRHHDFVDDNMVEKFYRNYIRSLNK